MDLCTYISIQYIDVKCPQMWMWTWSLFQTLLRVLKLNLNKSSSYDQLNTSNSSSFRIEIFYFNLQCENSSSFIKQQYTSQIIMYTSFKCCQSLTWNSLLLLLLRRLLMMMLYFVWRSAYVCVLSKLNSIATLCKLLNGEVNTVRSANSQRINTASGINVMCTHERWNGVRHRSIENMMQRIPNE